MGVDVTHIIKHDFKDVKNYKAAKKYLLQTLKMLKEKFCIHLDNDDARFEIRDEDVEDLMFRLPPFACDFYLRDGFWQIESNFHYCKLVWPIDGVYWLHDRIYDIARALGQTEAWHADEFHTWNCDYCEMETIDFDSWLKKTEKKFLRKHHKPIPLFSPETASIECYDTVYHDTFIGCNERFNELQSKIKDYRLMGISRIYKNYVPCEKDGYAYLIDADTLTLISNEPIDAICRVYNDIELVYKLK